MAELSDKFKELYPEHTKFEAAKENGHDQVEQFLHWVESQPDLQLASGPEGGSPYLEDWGPDDDTQHEKVLTRYYGIDIHAFHMEKDKMLERIRETGKLD